MATTALDQDLIAEGAMLMRHSTDQYHAMIESGFMPEGEPYELLGGLLVRKDRSAVGEDPMTVGHDHARAVSMLARLGRRLESPGCHMRTQLPITIPPYDEPEPDGVIVIGSEDDYHEHPGPRDVLCVIEVADASLRRDREIKGKVYSGSGIPMYIIINLVDRTIEVFTRPVRGKRRYGHQATLASGQVLSLPTAAGRQLKLAVDELLP